MPSAAATIFETALDAFNAADPILILTHNDADGLSAGAILARSFDAVGRSWDIRILGRGENPWSDAMRAEVAGRRPGGLIVADLGLREGDVVAGLPTVVIDHHVPTGAAGAATVITGFGEDPIPTTSLLAYRCAETVAPAGDLLWLAAVGLIGDLGDKAPFPELAEARKAQTATAMETMLATLSISLLTDLEPLAELVPLLGKFFFTCPNCSHV